MVISSFLIMCQESLHSWLKPWISGLPLVDLFPAEPLIQNLESLFYKERKNQVNDLHTCKCVSLDSVLLLPEQITLQTKMGLPHCSAITSQYLKPLSFLCTTVLSEKPSQKSGLCLRSGVSEVEVSGFISVAMI